MDVLALHPTEESIRKALECGPYGRCVYHCDNNVVDHQVVNMELEGGATSALPCALLQAAVTAKLKLWEQKAILRRIWATISLMSACSAKNIAISMSTSLLLISADHAGGDNRMVSELLDLVAGTADGKTALTSIDRSLESHYARLRRVFAPARRQIRRACRLRKGKGMMKYGITVISGKDGPVAIAYTQDTGYAVKILLCTVIAVFSLLILTNGKITVRETP